MCIYVCVWEWHSREGVWQEWHKIAINHWSFVNELKVVHSLSYSRQGLSAIQKCVCLCVDGMNSLFRTHHEYWWAQTNGRYKNRVFVGIAAGWCDAEHTHTHQHFLFFYFLLLLLLHHHLFLFFINLSPSLPQCILCNKKHTRLKFHIFNITTIRTAFWFTFDNSTDTVHTPVFMMGMKFIRVKLASQHVSYKIYCILCLLDWWIPSWCALCVLIVSPSTSSLVLFLFCFFQVKSSKI